MFCSECEAKLIRLKKTTENKVLNYFICSNYKKHGKNTCDSHYIREDVILDIILRIVQMNIAALLDLQKTLNMKNKAKVDELINKLNISLNQIEKELSQTIHIKSQLYEDYRQGILSQSDFIDMRSAFEDRCIKLQEKRHNIISQIKDVKNNMLSNPSIKEYLKFKDVNLLNREILVSLINKIVVDKDINIEIDFKFKDEFRILE